MRPLLFCCSPILSACLLAAWALPGCTPADGKDGVDTAAAGDADPTDIVAVVSPAMATVLVVTWSTAVPTTGFVIYGEDETYALQTPVEAEPSTSHRALLLGMPGDTDVHFRVVTTEVDTLLTSAAQVAHTDPIPNGFPTLTRTGGEDPIGGYISLPLIRGEERTHDWQLRSTRTAYPQPPPSRNTLLPSLFRPRSARPRLLRHTSPRRSRAFAPAGPRHARLVHGGPVLRSRLSTIATDAGAPLMIARNRMGFPHSGH